MPIAQPLRPSGQNVLQELCGIYSLGQRSTSIQHVHKLYFVIPHESSDRWIGVCPSDVYMCSCIVDLEAELSTQDRERIGHMSNQCPLHNLFVRRAKKYYRSYVEFTRLGSYQHNFNMYASFILRFHMYHLADGLGCVQVMLICAVSLWTLRLSYRRKAGRESGTWATDANCTTSSSVGPKSTTGAMWNLLVWAAININSTCMQVLFCDSTCIIWPVDWGVSK